MQKQFNHAVDTLKEALKGFSEKAGRLEGRASTLRDMHWGEEGALKSIIPLCAEAGDIAMSTRVLQDALGSCSTLAGLEVLATRVQDLRARLLFLEDSLLQEEEEVRGRLQAVLDRLR